MAFLISRAPSGALLDGLRVGIRPEGYKWYPQMPSGRKEAIMAKLYTVNGGCIIVEETGNAYGFAGYENSEAFVELAAFKMRLKLRSIHLVNGWDAIDEELEWFEELEDAGYIYVSRYALDKYWEVTKKLDEIEQIFVY